MRAGPVCDACFGLMVREDRRRLRLPPYSILYPVLCYSNSYARPLKVNPLLFTTHIPR